MKDILRIKKFLIIIILGTHVIKSSDAYQFGMHDGGERCCDIKKIGYQGLFLEQLCDNRCGNKDRSGSGFVFENYIPDNQFLLDGDMNFEKVRDQFPIFKTMVHNYPFIYFDSASTAQMPQSVLDAMAEYYIGYKSNVGRGLYVYAEQATYMFELTRSKIAYFIGAQPCEIIFTSGATAGINLVAHIWANHNIKSDEEIIISEVEHNANFIPWQQLAKRTGIVLKRAPLDGQGKIDIDTLKSMISSKTKLVAVTHQSNILGVENDVESIVQIAHSVGAKVLIDAAQSIVHKKIDVSSLQCDFLVFSGHKLFGPTGVGVLYMNQSVYPECILENFGGGMVLDVTAEKSEFKNLPYCLEPGTQSIAQVIGLGAAIDFIHKNINLNQAQQHETKLVRILAQELVLLPSITIISPIPTEDGHSNMVTFISDKYHAYDIAEYLNLFGIAVRAGYHCVQPYHDKLGGTSSVRVSFSVYNTEQEVIFLIKCLKQLLCEN